MDKSDRTGDPAIRGCLESCERLLAVLASVTPEQYAASWNGHNGIGPHMRHCAEHLTALRAGLASGTIHYDARKRDPVLETEPSACAAAVKKVIQWLAALDPSDLERPLTAYQIPQVDAPPAGSRSSLRRELLFVTSHTIHHLAVVAMLAELNQISLPGQIGVAYSTTAYERQRADQSPAARAPAP